MGYYNRLLRKLICRYFGHVWDYGLIRDKGIKTCVRCGIQYKISVDPIDNNH